MRFALLIISLFICCACQRTQHIHYNDIAEPGLLLQNCLTLEELRQQPKIVLDQGQEVQLCINDNYAAEHGVLSVFVLMMSPDASYAPRSFGVGPIGIQRGASFYYEAPEELIQGDHYMLFQQHIPLEQTKELGFTFNRTRIAHYKNTKQYPRCHWHGFNDPDRKTEDFQEPEEIEVGEDYIQEIDLKGSLCPMRIGSEEFPIWTSSQIQPLQLNPKPASFNISALGNDRILLECNGFLNPNDLKSRILLRVWKNNQIYKPDQSLMHDSYMGGLQMQSISRCILEFDSEQWGAFAEHDKLEIQLLYHEHKNQNLGDFDYLEKAELLIDTTEQPLHLSNRIELIR